MIFELDIITFILTTYFAILTFVRLVRKDCNAIHICLIVYYIMNCLPICVDLFADKENLMMNSTSIVYKAMTDYNVAIIYDVFCISTCYILYKFANKRKEIAFQNIYVPRALDSTTMRILLTLLMFVPLLSTVALAPNPNIYLTYCYFYTSAYNEIGVEYLYHNEVMHKVLMVTFFVGLLKYYAKKKTTPLNCIDTYLCIFVIAWINQKRTTLLFFIIGILVIDFIKQNHSSVKAFMRKTIIYLSLYFAYFVYYAIWVKPTGDDDYGTYRGYFSRLFNEKVAIYDILYDNKMLEYIGQSVLFDLLWFVPRSFWPDKPAAYCKYFTAYAVTGNGSKDYWVPFNYQVNIWADWVSSFGLIGHYLALIFLVWFVCITQKSKRFYVKLCGLLFAILYLSFGFEGFICVMFLFLVFVLLKDKILKTHVKLMS